MLELSTMHWMTSATAACLLVHFYALVWRRSRQPYALWWCGLLICACLGHSLALLDGASTRLWAAPLAHALVASAFAAVWASVRALNRKRTSGWVFVTPGVVVLVSSFVLDPAEGGWTGEAFGIASLAVLLSLTAVELWFLESRYAWARPFVIGCGVLSVYLSGRFVVAMLDGFDGGAFGTPLYDHLNVLLMFLLMIAASFRLATEGLEQYAETLRRRTQQSSARDAAELQEKAEHTRAQLDEAARVQTRLMPHKAPDLPGYEVAGACIPSGQGSGDFFDWQRTPCGLTVTIGDVMGKGMGAAMIAATMRAALRAGIAQSSTTTLIRSIDSVIEPDLAVNDSFVTLFHAQLSPESGRLDIIDAGHGLGIVVRADGTRTRILGGNLPLGILPEQEWTARDQHLDAGDVLLVFSDGLLDLFDGRGDQFERAVHAALTEGRSPNDIVKAVRRLARGRQLTDDVTVVAVRRTAPVPARRASAAPDAELTAAS